MLSSKQALKNLVARGRTDLALHQIVAATKPLADPLLISAITA
ncbi:MAG: hypothetical protein ACKVUS_22680 [Saprospiraceae bacterium]